ncbi:hypothetical protein BH11MYX1_BH11MYX1_38180 [soil metagenome]
MRTNAKLSTGKLAGYGYGVFVGELEGHRRIEHEGGLNGFISELARYPDDDVTIVVLANTEGDMPTQLENKISRLMYLASLGEPGAYEALASKLASTNNGNDLALLLTDFADLRTPRANEILRRYAHDTRHSDGTRGPGPTIGTMVSLLLDPALH